MNLDDLTILLLGVSVLIFFLASGAFVADFLSNWRHNRRAKKNSDVHWMNRNTIP